MGSDIRKRFEIIDIYIFFIFFPRCNHVLIDYFKFLLKTFAKALAHSLPLFCTSLPWEKLGKMTAQEILDNYSAQP